MRTHRLTHWRLPRPGFPRWGTVRQAARRTARERLQAALLGGALLILVPAALTACGTTDEVDSATPVVEEPTEIGGLLEGMEIPEFNFTGPWFNADATTLQQMSEDGSVVLVEFWNRSCEDCLDEIAMLDDLHDRYSERGLVVLGVHTPDFDFEQQPELLEETVTSYDVTFPVVHDGDRAAWLAFENEARPSRYLVDAEGVVLYRQAGAGAAADTEAAVRAALEAIGVDLSAVPSGTEPVTAGGVDEEGPDTSRDLYFGYQHNYHPAGVYAAQPEYYEAPEGPLELIDPGAPRELGLWYAHGEWDIASDALLHASVAEAAPAYVVFRFNAGTVSLVMSSTADEPVEVILQLDGFPLRAAQAGPDVQWDRVGRSVVIVDEPRVYEVAILPEDGDHQMRVSTHDAGLALYAASFGATDGEAP